MFDDEVLRESHPEKVPSMASSFCALAEMEFVSKGGCSVSRKESAASDRATNAQKERRRRIFFMVVNDA